MGNFATSRCSECHLESPNPNNISIVSVSTVSTARSFGNPANATIDFASHIIGKEFLNSPHARFTGTSAQLTAGTGTYDSHFSDGTCSITTDLTKAACTNDKGTWTPLTPPDGGCTTCHNVHKSTVPEIDPITSASMKNACGITCHTSNANFTTINHPNGPGTPLENAATDVEGVCVTCHMPVTLTGVNAHVFRISTDPNYSTFPTAAQYAAGQTTANTYPEGSTNWPAVAIDLDLACGQCHGGGPEGAGAKYYPMSKAQLAVKAQNMHPTTLSPPTAAMAAKPTVSGYTVTFVDKSTDPQEPSYDLRIEVDWGDGTALQTGQPGGTFMHTYNKAGTFTITLAATDTYDLTGSTTASVTVPDK